MHQGLAPSDAPVIQLDGATNLVDLLSEAGLVKSKSEGRRLVEQGGVRLDGEPVTHVGLEVTPSQAEQVIQAGKRRFVRVVS